MKEEDLRIRIAALKAASRTMTGKDYGTTAQDTIRRAEAFEAYLRGEPARRR